MSVTATLETVAQHASERQKEAQQRYRDLVVSLADGNEPDADICHVVVDEANKTVDQLQSDVQRLVERREMRSQLDSIPDLEAKRAENERTIEQAAAELKAAKAKYESDTQSARASNTWLRQEVARVRRLKLDLRRTSSPELHQQVEVIEGELDKVWRAILGTTKQRQDAEQAHESLRLTGKYQGNRLSTAETDATLSMLAERAERHAEAENELRARQDALKAQRRDIEKQMLEP